MCGERALATFNEALCICEGAMDVVTATLLWYVTICVPLNESNPPVVVRHSISAVCFVVPMSDVPEVIFPFPEPHTSCPRCCCLLSAWLACACLCHESSKCFYHTLDHDALMTSFVMLFPFVSPCLLSPLCISVFCPFLPFAFHSFISSAIHLYQCICSFSRPSLYVPAAFRPSRLHRPSITPWFNLCAILRDIQKRRFARLGR